MKRNQSGFSLIELVVALAILAVAAVFVAQATTNKANAERVEVTSNDMQEILEGAMNYYTQNNAWPGSISVMQSAGDLPAGSIVSAWNGVYSTAVVGGGNQFQVGTTVSNAAFAAQIAGGLPFGQASGAVVSGAVVIPGEEVALKAYLPRDGHLPMTGNLQMNGNNITGTSTYYGYALNVTGYAYAASYMQAPTMYSSTVNTTDIHTTNSYASNLLYSGNAVEAAGYMYAPIYYGTGATYYMRPQGLSYIDNIDIAGNNSYTYANGMNTHDCFGATDAAGCSISQSLFYATVVGTNTGSDSTENPCESANAQVFQFPMSISAADGSAIDGFSVGVSETPSTITVNPGVGDSTSADDTDVLGDYGLLIRCPD